MAEFTGERVVPGEVDDNLWNEHFARYAFAARLARMKRVLDAGCGTGYGTAELARKAAATVGVDSSHAAIEYARLHYPLPNVSFLQASCTACPFGDRSFDLVVLFELIEHLKNWQECLVEARRLLAPRGQCIISTPNKDYYADSRGPTGPNPFHEHEFTYNEFRGALLEVFPHVSMFVQNHLEGIVFQPAMTFSPAEARIESGAGSPEESHFFVAVCALTPLTGAPTFLYVPRAANVLRERERHIESLNGQVAELRQDRDKLLEMFRRQTDELEERNRWAEKLNQELERAGSAIRGLQAEAAELAEDARKKAEWALALDRQVRELEAQLNLVRASRWIKLGNRLGFGPRLGDG